jgi:hypothetical protein
MGKDRAREVDAEKAQNRGTDRVLRSKSAVAKIRDGQ